MRINSSVYKSFAEFVARHGDEPFESFFAAACTWRKTLCAERVFVCTQCVQTNAGRSEIFFDKKGVPFLSNERKAAALPLLFRVIFVIS